MLTLVESDLEGCLSDDSGATCCSNVTTDGDSSAYSLRQPNVTATTRDGAGDRLSDGAVLPAALMNGSPCDHVSSSLHQCCITANPNGLSYQPGDFVLLIDSCSVRGRHGCPMGINLSSGSHGIFNCNAGRRVPQYFAWSLFR